MSKGDPRVPPTPSAAKKPPPVPGPGAHRRAASVAVRPPRLPKGSDAPLTSRTATLDDPMTTSLLAEVSRQRSTIEIRAEEIDAAIAAEAAEAAAAAGGDPDDRT